MLTASAVAFEKAGSVGGVVAPADKSLDLSSSKKVIEPKDSGSVVRIPGLGALGVLPKLDFGLELLYGDERPELAPREKEDADSDGLSIRGTLKHRF